MCVPSYMCYIPEDLWEPQTFCHF